MSTRVRCLPKSLSSSRPCKDPVSLPRGRAPRRPFLHQCSVRHPVLMRSLELHARGVTARLCSFLFSFNIMFWRFIRVDEVAVVHLSSLLDKYFIV